MENGHKLTKKEKKELKKIEWQEKLGTEKRNKMLKKYGIIAGAVLIVIISIFGLIQIANAPSSTSSSVTLPPVTKNDISEGNPKAKVTIVEYADFECPACAAYHPLVNQLLSDFNGKIFYVYRMFPLSTIHPNAIISAQAGYAAWKQGKFFQMDDLLFNGQNDWASLSDPKPIFISYAKQLKLNVTQFQNDMNSTAAQNYVADSQNQATSIGINQTPTFFVNGVEIQNPQSYNDFKKIIQDALNKK